MNKAIRRRLAFAVAVLGTTLSLALPSVAQEKLVITLDTPPGHVRNQWIGKFAEALTERSEGRLTTEVFDSGQLVSSRDAGKAVARGDVGMAIVATPALARIEANLNVLDLPMFNGMAQAGKDKVVDGPLGQELAKMTAEKMHVVVPGKWYVLGALNTYSTEKAVGSFADLKDMQIRIPGAASWIAAYKAWGATPVNLPFTDVPLALQQGVVDAIVSSNVSILSAKLDESGLKHAFVNNLGIGYYMPIVSQTYWGSLSSEEQDFFRDTWNEFVPGQRAAAATQQAEARKTLEAAGMDFTDPSAAELAGAKAEIMKLQDGLAKDVGVSDAILAMAVEATK